MHDYKIYFAGKFHTTSQKHEVKNPFNGQVIASTYLAGNDELEEAIRVALNVKQQLKELAAYERSEALLHIAAQIREKKHHLSEILCMESGKPIRYALAEIERSIQTFTIAAEECKRLPKEYISLDWTPNGKNKEGIVKYFPIGMVAGIAPFNFPMNLAVHKIAPAIASGCPILLKPASSTPLSTLELARIIDETKLPKGAVSILPCDRKTGNMLVTDDRFNLLSFTGSPVVGWEMKKNAGRKKVVLELGGNAGVIIGESADIDLAVKKGMVSAFAYSGQICIHAQRFYVHEKLFNTFLEKMKQETNQLKKGDPLDSTTDISVMIDEENAKRAENWVNEAIQQGATLITGGKREGSFYHPTILTNTKKLMKVNFEEVFAPVICIEKIKSVEEGVSLINDSRFGLQCGVFTNSVVEMDYCFNHIDAGGILLNDVPSLRLDHMPYGGIKDSGLGREGVKYAILDMMEPKIMVK
jgi:acyl-CoA reductase-like NAD-dependent aldehyde dehydrogenase